MFARGRSGEWQRTNTVRPYDIISKDGDHMKMYHIALTENQVGKYAILTGDPGRVEHIAQYLDNPEFCASNREYTSWAGYIGGEKVNVTSVGIGGPSMAIGVEELFKLGCRNFIRIGTCGGISLDVKAGDIVIANAAVRQEGTGCEYLPLSYPAVSDFGISLALKTAVQSCRANGDYHIGVVQSKDSFYGEMEPERMPIKEYLQNLWAVYKRSGVLASEMECASLFLTAASLGAKAGAVLLSIWNEERRKELGDDTEFHDTDVMYKIAIQAIGDLIKTASNRQ